MLIANSDFDFFMWEALNFRANAESLNSFGVFLNKLSYFSGSIY